MKKISVGSILLVFLVLAGCKSIEVTGSGHEEYPQFKDGYRDGDPDAPKQMTLEEWKKMQEEEKAKEAEKTKRKKKKSDNT
ncbi:hypothetical protein J1N10_07965 [Carboxylicivirga sp. A043]|uniref:hypothetical protein n=1 Tax=Carboxylicivirga litoralis TaxID=2816963 RepID=UPI0021CB0768|nr:hypothetical protein [Carboxylicivirga sp. A043]MCU4155908.1 hypothetical protein [Carboxylicivirga sp. A043]